MMILGIGLSMAAAVFPAAMTYNKRSADQILGGIMCRNAMTIARVVLKSSGPWTNALTRAAISEEELRYAGQQDMSCMVLVRRCTTGTAPPTPPAPSTPENDFHLVVVAYRKQSGHPVTLQTFTGARVDNHGDVSLLQVPKDKAQYLQPGAPFINLATGEYAMIVAVVPSYTDTTAAAVLDRRAEIVTGDKNVGLVHEDGASASPVLTVLATRTPLGG